MSSIHKVSFHDFLKINFFDKAAAAIEHWWGRWSI